VGNLGGLATDQTDMIKNQLAFSNYIPGFGWFGQLEYVLVQGPGCRCLIEAGSTVF